MGLLALVVHVVRTQNVRLCGALLTQGANDLLASSALGVIGLLRKPSHEAKKRLRLADESVHINEALERDRGSVLGGGWPNDRTYREFAAEKRAWLRHD